ncbi:hypothetical protein DOTSEDRAFT_72392 [Dothistroma septosporum NZE10]|uniref:Uncharacterized protein n=1 Tax=Dothistroma septosporum (strain NZE10 / CBS 128990) TaxID=675120 RepID=M2Y3S7_DOTSN|nr:hypothetical protein DOTSEDRAFT_72392 [Dothistroma septosporum NZE10]
MLELDPTSSISGTLGQNETVRVVLVFKFIEYPGMMSNTAPQAPGDFPHGADGTDSSSFTGGDLGRSRGKVHEVCPGWCNIC